MYTECIGWKIMPGEREEILVGLRNMSKTNSIIVFGILSSVTHPSKSHEVYKKVIITLPDLL